MSLCSILCIHALKTRLKQNKAKAIQKGNKNLFFFFFSPITKQPTEIHQTVIVET